MAIASAPSLSRRHEFASAGSRSAVLDIGMTCTTRAPRKVRGPTSRQACRRPASRRPSGDPSATAFGAVPFLSIRSRSRQADRERSQRWKLYAEDRCEPFRRLAGQPPRRRRVLRRDDRVDLDAPATSRLRRRSGARIHTMSPRQARRDESRRMFAALALLQQ